MNDDPITEEQFHRFIALQERFLATMERVANRTESTTTDAATPPDNVAPPSAPDKPACDEQEITQRLARVENALIELQYVIQSWLSIYAQRYPYGIINPFTAPTAPRPTTTTHTPPNHTGPAWTPPPTMKIPPGQLIN